VSDGKNLSVARLIDHRPRLHRAAINQTFRGRQPGTWRMVDGFREKFDGTQFVSWTSETGEFGETASEDFILWIDQQGADRTADALRVRKMT
jgi:hypothetical protein